MPYANVGSTNQSRKNKIAKSSLLIALSKLNPGLSKSAQKKVFDEVLDELTCYIERTIQLFFIYYKIGMFTETKVPNSLFFRLYYQAKSHYRLTMVKLGHRLKVSTFLLMQMAPEDLLVDRVKNMNHFQLMTTRVAMMEAL